ncbi:hypothetical protein GYMLUDRAFT_828414, partial [Collybiopsis luxurians FD-317 M1]
MAEQLFGLDEQADWDDALFYSSDKFQTYIASGGGGKAYRLKAKQILFMDDPDEVPVAVKKVYTATMENQRAQTPTVTRFEARVPVHHAVNFYNRTLMPEAFNDVVHILPAGLVWAWRIHKLYACYLLMRYIATLKKDSRSDIQHLTLVGVLVFLFNSLHSRPGEMHWDRALAALVFPVTTMRRDSSLRDYTLRTPRNKDDEVAYMERGGLWLPRITFPRPDTGDVLRFEFCPKTADRNIISKVLNVPWVEIEKRFSPSYMSDPFQSGHIRRKLTKPSGSPKRRRVELPGRLQDFQYEKPRTYFDHAPDLPRDAHVGSTPPDQTFRSASAFSNGLLVQIMERLGTVGATHIPYCRLSLDQIQRISFDTFKDMNLSTYLVSFQYTRDAKTWAQIKEILFPSREQTPPNIGSASTQGWRMVPLYMEFLALRERGGTDYEELRRVGLEAFDDLKWFPRVTRDRLIDNKARSSWTKIFAGALKTGTAIALNPKFKDDVTCFSDRAPVLSDPLSIDPIGGSRHELVEQHQSTLDPLAIAAFGEHTPRERSGTGTSQMSNTLLNWVKVRGRKQGGRTLIVDRGSPDAVDEQSVEDMLMSEMGDLDE